MQNAVVDRVIFVLVGAALAAVPFVAIWITQPTLRERAKVLGGGVGLYVMIYVGVRLVRIGLGLD